MKKKLIIIGAGGHGKVIKDIVEDLKLYERIDFVDDSSSDSIGMISDLEELHKIYQDAIVGIGDNRLRELLMHKVEVIGYNSPVIIHQTANVSKLACIGRGTVVEPGAIINANTFIDKGCIISVGSIIDHDVHIGRFVHVNAGAICKAGSVIEDYKKVDAGEIVKGY